MNELIVSRYLSYPTRRSLSPNTNPLPLETCNVPINMPEEMREILDFIRPKSQSRNSFLTASILEGLRFRYPEAAQKIETVLKQRGREFAFRSMCLFGLLSVLALTFTRDLERTPRRLVTRRSIVRRVSIQKFNPVLG